MKVTAVTAAIAMVVSGSLVAGEDIGMDYEHDLYAKAIDLFGFVQPLDTGPRGFYMRRILHIHAENACHPYGLWFRFPETVQRFATLQESPKYVTLLPANAIVSSTRSRSDVTHSWSTGRNT